MESMRGPSTHTTQVPRMEVSPTALTPQLAAPSSTPSLLITPSLPLPSVGSSELDIRLHYPFLCLSPENVLKVVAAILTEKRIIFSSSHYTMLTFVIEVGCSGTVRATVACTLLLCRLPQCLFHYISPLEWRYTVITTVAS